MTEIQPLLIIPLFYWLAHEKKLTKSIGHRPNTTDSGQSSEKDKLLYTPDGLSSKLTFDPDYGFSKPQTLHSRL